MNLFCFLIECKVSLIFGCLEAQDGREAREKLQERVNKYPKGEVKHYTYFGITSKSYSEALVQRTEPCGP